MYRLTTQNPHGLQDDDHGIFTDLDEARAEACDLADHLNIAVHLDRGSEDSYFETIYPHTPRFVYDEYRELDFSIDNYACADDQGDY